MDPSRLTDACAAGYFPFSENHLIEFPGYVAHCHILSHEDREMMRPFMMQPSDCGITQPWPEKYQDINTQIREIVANLFDGA